MTERLDFVTPVGRFVSGDLINKRDRDSDNRPIPEDKQRFEYGIAFEKTALWPMLTEQFYPWIAQHAARDQNAMQRLGNWFQTFSGFSMKISDGDKPNQRGQVNQNTQGCFVMWFSSTYPPQTVDPANQSIDPNTVKRGFYVQVAGNITPNGDRNAGFQPGDRAGIYLNGNFVRLVAEGDEIRTGPSADEAFGNTGAPTSLPPGARPLGSTTGAAGAFNPGNPPMPGGVQAPAPTAPAAPSAPPQAPGVPPSTASAGEPYHGIMQPPGAAPGAPGAPGGFTPPPLPGQN